tara:strand:- start:292 stop:1569 length:1278 start_codon:yes stop_codon:yes gene_type:complete
MSNSSLDIAIIGMGYVGLPLAVAFAKKYKVIGFDIDTERLNQLKENVDITNEISEKSLKNAQTNIYFTSDINDIKKANFYIITVPTPIDDQKQPNLSPLEKASEIVGKTLKNGDIVVFESTVYPGATEEICVPILEAKSKLKYNKDFFVGYSPERINPGDKEHTVTNILKVTSGSNEMASEVIDQTYSSVIDAGTFRAASIKVAEAAKVIENTQRDLNIALVNELTKIFNILKIDTKDVLDAAGTKWNFLPFKPGLVGGHCIGVDPYYLTHKAKSVGYNPEIILSGRRMNDGMASYVAAQLVQEMLSKKIEVKGSKVLILGLTFKENCPDIRNTKVVDLISKLKDFGAEVDIHDPWIDKDINVDLCGANLKEKIKSNFYDGIILAVAHDKFKEMGIKKVQQYAKVKSVIYDLKYIFPAEFVDIRL